MKKGSLITMLIILLIIIFSIFALTRSAPETSKEIAECIGEHAVLYTQLGCRACGAQENLFGENYQYLNVIDCFFKRDKCSDITAVPTWIIKGEEYTGVQSIEKLQELTGC